MYEIPWRQRSKALWLQVGDQNTKYFHKKASQIRKKNFITWPKDDEGLWHVGKEEITLSWIISNPCLLHSHRAEILNSLMV